jgi:hypothetical protein
MRHIPKRQQRAQIKGKSMKQGTRDQSMHREKDENAGRWLEVEEGKLGDFWRPGRASW